MKIVGQAEQLLFDIGEQLIVVASGQVGTPDASSKKSVADQGPFFVVVAKDHMSWSVPGNKANFEFLFSYQ